MSPVSDQAIAVIARGEAERQDYVQWLEALGVQARAHENLGSLRADAGRVHYSGVIIDMKAILGCSAEEKRLLHELEACFPLLRVVRHARTGRLSGILAGQHLEGPALFHAFAAQVQAQFTPRGLRTCRRLPLHLSVLLPPADGAGPLCVRAATEDVSEGGMFVVVPEAAPGSEDGHTLLRPRGAELPVLVRELDDGAPIRTRIRWGLPWGNPHRHLPGYGVEFLDLRPGQAEALRDLLSAGVSGPPPALTASAPEA